MMFESVVEGKVSLSVRCGMVHGVVFEKDYNVMLYLNSIMNINHSTFFMGGKKGSLYWEVFSITYCERDV